MDGKKVFVDRGKTILVVEQLEDRTVPSIFTPSQIEQAYGFNLITFSTQRYGVIPGDGSGQTIAIVDAYDDPNIVKDLQTFDQRFGIAAPPSLTVVKQSGTVANSAWSSEIALDVEWAHAIAPGARMILGEARSDSLSDLVSEVDTVADMPNVSVVSMSWSASEWPSEAEFDNNFTTPAGHSGVTYVASSGDAGAPPGWPAISSNVLSVGGTSLVTNSNGSYKSETAWILSGGGVSQYEAKPVYQDFVTTNASMRTNPDVSFDADPNTGLYVYNSYGGGGWSEAGGTSAGTPVWAALIAIANQGRYLQGKPILDGPSQTLYAIYSMAATSESTYFHDVTSGYNAYAAVTGYDEVTGNGSPVANEVVAGLIGWNGDGPSGYVGTASIITPAVVKKAAIKNVEIVTPGETSQYLAPTGVGSALTSTETSASASPLEFNSRAIGTMQIGSQLHSMSTESVTVFRLASSESDSVPTESELRADSQFDCDWPFGPSVEVNDVSVPHAIEESPTIIEITEGEE